MQQKPIFEEKFDWMNLEGYQLGTLGCYMSHYLLLKKIYSEHSDLKTALILEDDVKIHAKTIESVKWMMDHDLPEDWDIIRSTWSSSQHLSPINYCHPLSNFFEPEMLKRFLPRMMNIKYDCRACCPVMNTFYGGTHFQIINISSIPKIIEYLDSEALLPIDALYTTHAINVYHKKMDVDFGVFKGSGIQIRK